MAAGVVKDSGASAGFDVYEEDDVSGGSLDSDLFWDERGRSRTSITTFNDGVWTQVARTKPRRSL